MEEYPTYPSKVCPTCKELVEGTFNLKIMYEKTSEVLKNLLSPFEELDIKIEPEDPELLEETDNCDSIQPDTVEDTEKDEIVTVEDTEKYEIDVKIDPKDHKLLLRIQEDAIKLQNTPYHTLSRNEKRNIYKRKKRYMDRQQEHMLAAVIDKEIEEAFDQSEVKLKKEHNVSHLCPVCWIEITDPLEFREHVRTHKVIKSYLKGKLLQICDAFTLGMIFEYKYN